MPHCIFTFILLLLNLVSAQSQTINIGINGCYKMGVGELQTQPSRADLNQYDLIKVKDIGSYINKLVVSSSSKKYFSFILADLPGVIKKKIETDPSNSIVAKSQLKTKSTVYYFYKIKRPNDLLLVKIVYQQPDLSNSIMVDIISKTESNWDTSYKFCNEFIKNLSCEN
jgi:hypothetical protein